MPRSKEKDGIMNQDPAYDAELVARATAYGEALDDLDTAKQRVNDTRVRLLALPKEWREKDLEKDSPKGLTDPPV